MDVQTTTNTFIEDFQQFHSTGKERENSCTIVFNLSLSRHHQKQQQTEEANKFWSQ